MPAAAVTVNIMVLLPVLSAIDDVALPEVAVMLVPPLTVYAIDAPVSDLVGVKVTDEVALPTNAYG